MSRDRDRILEQALKHELRAAGTPPAGGCLDAETLGAWADGGLDPAAMAAVEAHVSSCARCQAMAATFARASTPVVAAAPEARAFPLWKWWLAPIAAGAAAVTLWMVVPEQQPQLMTSVAPAQSTTYQQAPLAESAQPVPAAPAANAEALAARDNAAAAGRDDRARVQVAEERKEETSPQRQERPAMADAVAPAAPPPPAPRPAAMPPPAAVALEAPAAAPAEIGALQKRAAAIEIATLDPSLGWRIVGDRIERSDNGGRTWTVKRQNSRDGLVAGSAPSAAVAWFVGRAGNVLLTTDSGATFSDVSLAEPLDLASVAATDARSAMIFSVVGRRFRTDDGGQTWRPF